MADWDWFLASDYGRDKILRTQVDELAYAASSAAARSARLSSQLASLQGSLDTRLSALSAAFDAYVELGDVREQLAAYAGLAAVRRDVMAAVDALAAGRTATPVDPGEEAYWLPYATNAVIALAAGAPDPEAEAEGRRLSRDADLFLVTLLGALGRGGLVADRLPDLLVGDGTLTPAQVTLWDAYLAGVFPEPAPSAGPVEGPVLAAIGDRWRSSLAAGDGAEWLGWVAARSGTDDAAAQLQWIADLLAGRVLLPLLPADDEGADPSPADRLRAAAITMVAAGSDAERDLLLRARELRRRIENPTGALPEAAPPQEVRELVRQAFAISTDPDRRAALLGWLRPGLLQAVEASAARPPLPLEPVRRSLPGGVIAVGPTGPVPDQLATIRSRVGEQHPGSRARPLVPAVVAGIVALVAVVGLVAGWPTVGVVLLLLGAVVAAGVALKLAYDRRAGQAAVAADEAKIDQVVAEATQQASVEAAAHEKGESARHRLVAELRAELGGNSPRPDHRPLDEARTPNRA